MLSLSRKIGNLKVSWFLDGGTSQKSSLCNASDALWTKLRKLAEN